LPLKLNTPTILFLGRRLFLPVAWRVRTFPKFMI
jgi:hypothetical protein